MANPIVQQINAELKALQNELGQFKSTVEYLNGAKSHVKEAIQSMNHSETHFNNKIEELKNTYNSVIKLTDSVGKIVSKIDTINFPERLQNIENTVKETITFLNETRKATLEELQKASEIITKADFDGRFKRLQVSIDDSVKSNNIIAKSIENQKLPEKIDGFEKKINKKLEISISDLRKNTERIATETAKSIHVLNLPIRIEKLDANISGIISAIQNVQGRIESVERNIGDKLKDTADKQVIHISTFQEKILKKLDSLDQEIKAETKIQKTKTYITWLLILLGVVAIYLLG